MAQLSWSLIALDNLQASAEYIERDSPLYAATLVQRVFDAGYRIVYRVEGDSVRILLVLHAAGDLQARSPREAWDLQ